MRDFIDAHRRPTLLAMLDDMSELEFASVFDALDVGIIVLDDRQRRHRRLE